MLCMTNGKGLCRGSVRKGSLRETVRLEMLLGGKSGKGVDRTGNKKYSSSVKEY